MNNNLKFSSGLFPWLNLAQAIETGERIALLYVIQSEGSSPGRQGFSMIVKSNGDMQGSIGGGFMEQKLVELVLSKLSEKRAEPFIKRQIHSKEASTNQSGMICSGEQTIAFYFLNAPDLNWLNALIQCLKKDEKGQLIMDDKGIRFVDFVKVDSQYKSDIQADHWTFEEQIGFKESLFVIGGGHVGLALSELMARLGFQVTQLDNRNGLNTMSGNTFAHRKEVIEYERIAEYIPTGFNTYVVLVSFGYRTDKAILKKLLGKQYRYLGMLGSEAKVNTLIKELSSEGFSEEVLKQVHTPIGIPIHSRTPFEIAVSIAAEIISVKNSEDKA